ncbi:hypothetical protein L1987_19217 [Smallanthus sonchifolius]|uniref:Uncharacterized protein n=1 Tax=Smallanthus sonchifolius TaxID=185202 RepID=A0ACB9IQ43_9ASTR|nr:hypothetical protein L1987_19217 [Smallanthus sonchifolius]
MFNCSSLIGNRLNGPIPKELGNISTLQSLTVEDNMMTGIIPAELGNLSSIERLFFNSNFFTGELPASFAKLTTMKELRIQASGLEGPIPSSITLLENLTDLRISDLRGPDSFCPPFRITTLFENLILRSCNLIGQLPQSLPLVENVLDFSFNKLNGSIPARFSELFDTDFIYLTGNLLSGDVPDWMPDIGQRIDLSYNNFTFRSSFNCLMRETNLFASFSEDIISDLPPGGASYFTSTDSRWGFSNTGNFMDNRIGTDSYIVKNTSRLLMNNSELYMSARASALSLTYYGFCLVNGSYNVSLHFAEILFTDDATYSSLGRRVFDIYIQGELVEKDFDISEKAGGAGKEFVKNYTVNVNTTLLIRLNWAGKGTTNIPFRGVYGPLISAISVNPIEQVQQETPEPVPKKKSTRITGTNGLKLGFRLDSGSGRRWSELADGGRQ